MSDPDLSAFHLGIAVVLALLVAQRLSELAIARRNSVHIRSIGGQEYYPGHYPIIVALHVAWLVAWPLEAWAWGPDSAPVLTRPWVVALAALALATQGLRYWAISSLGSFWNTRIFVVPGMTMVARGPYRFFCHPNYIAVAIELSAIPLIFSAWRSALVFGVANALILLMIRIPAEERALKQAQDPK